jgi:hypothetical protein
MHLLYCTFGNHFHHHLQAAFSAMSFLQERSEIDSINIITDTPSFYNHLKGHVNLITVTPEIIKEWKGPHDYFFRVKIKAIQHVAEMYAGSPVMYCDTDTFLYRNITELKADLLNGKPYMHEDEGEISTRPAKNIQRVWQAVKGKTYAGLQFEPTDHMRNAGVIAIPNLQNGKDVERVLQICDAICANSGALYLCEQFSFSTTLPHVYNAIGDSTPWIAHYWSNKPDWNQFILSWVTEQQFKGKSIDEMIAGIAEIDLGQIPVYIKRRSTAEKLHRRVDKLFPPKNEQYLRRNK